MPVIKVKSKEVKIKVPITTLRIEPTTQTKTVEPSIEEQLITPDEGIFALSSVTVNPVTSEIDENIKAENIKEGVSILGVEGTVASSDYNILFDESLDSQGLVGAITKIGNIDTSNRIHFNYFYSEFSNMVDFPDIDTSKAQTMRYMYNKCSQMITAPDMDMSNVTDAGYLYNSCTKLVNIPDHNTENVTDMTAVVMGCNYLKTFPNWNTSKVQKAGMFCYYAVRLETIPLLDFSSVVEVQNSFDRCSNLTNLGGFKDLGKSYLPTAGANNSYYTLNISTSTKYPEQSLINVLNGLYDIASKGCNAQKCVLGSTNLAKLTSAEGQQALARATEKGWTVS